MAFLTEIKKVFSTAFDLSAMFIKNCKKLLFMDIFLGVSREISQLIITILPSVVIWLCMTEMVQTVRLSASTVPEASSIRPLAALMDRSRSCRACAFSW